MKVAIDARYILATEDGIHPQGGIGRYTYELIRNLIELDPELELTLIVRARNRRPILDGASRVREIKYAAPPQTLRTLFALARQVEIGDVDLFHSPFNVLPYGLRQRAITTVHDMMWLDAPRLAASFWPKRLMTGTYYRYGMMNAFRRSAHILTVSQESKAAICRRFPEKEDKVTWIYHGVGDEFAPLPPEEAARLTARFGLTTGPFVLCVGQGSPYKNHGRAVAAFADAFADEPQVKLILVRRFSRFDPVINRMLNRKDLRGRLIVLPEVDDVELRGLYSLSMILLFPSLCEGFGMPALEAMACGTPAIVSDRGASAEICGDAALTVDAESVQSIAAGLRRIAGDSALRNDLAARGRGHASAFRWRRCAQATLDVYRKVASVPG